MLRDLFARSRYIVILAVIGSFLASVALLFYGALTVVGIIVQAFTHAPFTVQGVKTLEIESIEIIDLFLLGSVLYIVALGLYELFIDDRLKTPAWLVISSLESLKERVIGVIVVLLAVTFLGNVVEWDGNTNILALGLAVGVILLPLGYVLRQGFGSRPAEKVPESGEPAGSSQQD